MKWIDDGSRGILFECDEVPDSWKLPDYWTDDRIKTSPPASCTCVEGCVKFPDCIKSIKGLGWLSLTTATNLKIPLCEDCAVPIADPMGEPGPMGPEE